MGGSHILYMSMHSILLGYFVPNIISYLGAESDCFASTAQIRLESQREKGTAATFLAIQIREAPQKLGGVKKTPAWPSFW